MSPPLQHAAEKAVFDGREVPFYGWHYPPFFLAIAVLVAAVPYAWGLAIWLIASFAAYLAAIRAILPRPETWLAARPFPPCSSMSAMARTDSSPRRCSAAPCTGSIGGRRWPAC